MLFAVAIYGGDFTGCSKDVSDKLETKKFSLRKYF
jgi:hypothetical protein